jgi:hypothetical protein
VICVERNASLECASETLQIEVMGESLNSKRQNKRYFPFGESVRRHQPDVRAERQIERYRKTYSKIGDSVRCYCVAEHERLMVIDMWYWKQVKRTCPITIVRSVSHSRLACWLGLWLKDLLSRYWTCCFANQRQERALTPVIRSTLLLH